MVPLDPAPIPAYHFSSSMCWDGPGSVHGTPHGSAGPRAASSSPAQRQSHYCWQLRADQGPKYIHPTAFSAGKNTPLWAVGHGLHLELLGATLITRTGASHLGTGWSPEGRASLLSRSPGGADPGKA